MHHQTSQILFSYWDELRAGRQAPGRIEIEPARISTILPETLILEVTAPGSYRFRIAGTKLCEHLGMELRGLNFLGLWGPTDQRLLEEKFLAMKTFGRTTTLSVNSTTTSQTPINSELLILPLADASGNIHRFMGSWSVEKSSNWLGSDYLTNHSIAGNTTPSPARHADIHRVQPPSIADHPAYKRTVSSERRRFRVYDGGLS